MTYIDLVALFSVALIALAIAGVLADMTWAQTRSDRRHQARRIR